MPSPWQCRVTLRAATFGNKVEHDILANYPSTNALVATARFAISFVVTCCYPLQAHPTRACITPIVNKCSGESLSENVVHYAITTAFVAVTGTIALNVSDLGAPCATPCATPCAAPCAAPYASPSVPPKCRSHQAPQRAVCARGR